VARVRAWRADGLRVVLAAPSLSGADRLARLRETLDRLIREADCYDFRYSKLEDAVLAFERLST